MRAQNFRVESICRVLTTQGFQVAPRTYRNWKTAPPSARTITDAHPTEELRATIGTAEGLYGRRTMTAHLRRKGHHVAACTIDRLMRDEGLNGVDRGRQHRTTIPGGKDSRRAPDLLDRDFTADAPNRTWVTDFTYCRTWAGFVYVAFVIDCFSRAIVGWHASTVQDTAMLTTALKMALRRRDHGGHRVRDGLIHHSDAGSQYTSISFTETLALEGIAASIGSVGDAYDNALAESTTGLLKDRSSFQEQSVSARGDQDDRRHRIRDDGMGELVQYPPPAQHLGLRHSRRVRGHLLLSTIHSPTGDVASIGAARNPTRFT